MKQLIYNEESFQNLKNLQNSDQQNCSSAPMGKTQSATGRISPFNLQKIEQKAESQLSKLNNKYHKTKTGTKFTNYNPFVALHSV